MILLLNSPAFNRTSMESKQAEAQLVISEVAETFNRTSMESKQNLASPRRSLDGILLIEPVWNRNARLIS